MKHNLRFFVIRVIVLVILSNSFLSLKAQLLAFPGAEGFGRHATGGRFGTVYHVTNLNDKGVGSLRDALSSPNRIVVFDVAGVIHITDRMIVAHDIYIAGQTAPGEGITVYGNGWSFSGADNTVCRYMKIRMGILGDDGKDANGIADGHDMIFDHCSISWGRDENFSINSTTAYNITIQNSIISQGLMAHSAGGLIQADSITLYRNLYVDNTTRNNKVKGISQYVNNIVYGWKSGAYIMGGGSSGNSYVNATNNCFIEGPEDGVPPFNLGNELFHIYAADNIFDKNKNGILDPYLIPSSEYVGPPDFQTTPYNYPALPTLPASELVDSLLPFVGASLPYRDYADYYVVDEVSSFGRKGELIANENSLPFGAPSTWDLWTGVERIDKDGDGMPDNWETTNGTNPAVDDAMEVGANGYSHIENYINSITSKNSQDYLRSPMGLQLDSASQSSLHLSWLDYTEKEKGYIIEKKVNGGWEIIDTTVVNQNFVSISGMQPEQKDTFRVVAFNGDQLSGYSNELVAKTRPVKVPVLDTAAFTPDLTWTGAVNSHWDDITDNWLNKELTATSFEDSSQLLFPQRGQLQNIDLTTKVVTGDVLVNADNDYKITGSGFIDGTSSMNKAGTGTLSLLTNNSYTGPTVLQGGTITLNTLTDGGQPSSIGASENYGFNWVWNGGRWKYTGSTTSTDRNAVIDTTSEFVISDTSSKVTFNGILSGEGGLIKSGPGTMILSSENPYSGETVIMGGVLEVHPVSSSTQADDIIDNNRGIGTSSILRLHNGTYRTSGGSNTIYENYPLDLYVADSTLNGFEPNRNANLTMEVHGSGTLKYEIPYLRELVQGDWSDFSGQLIANSNADMASAGLLIIDNHVGFPNNSVMVTGTTKIVNWNNNETVSIGSLSGTVETRLSCGGTKAASFGFGRTTYIIGDIGTNETFHGVINNQLYGSNTDTIGETTIIKVGSGYWRLTGINTYSGTTTIEDGILIVNGENDGNGGINVTGGALAGTGSVSGNVEVQSGAALEPGDSSIGTFKIDANLTLQKGSMVEVEINKELNRYDSVVVTDSLIYGGLLQLHTTGDLAVGDVFKIFTPRDTVYGAFDSISPVIPAPGLRWKFRPDLGELKVVTPDFVEAPSDMKLTATTDFSKAVSAVKVKWGDNSENELNFVLERSMDSLSFKDIAYLGADTVQYIDSGLVPLTKYYYRIQAIGEKQASLYSPVYAIMTPPPYNPPAETSLPGPSNTQRFAGMLSQRLILSWKGGAYTDSFAVYMGRDSGSLSRLTEIAYADDPFYKVSDLAYNTDYYWRVDAIREGHTTTGTIWSFRTGSQTKLIAQYKFDEQAGDTAFNAVSHLLDGVANFSPDWYPAGGKLAGAVGFLQATAPTSAIIIPASGSILLDNTPFTISLWVKIPTDTYKYGDGKDCYLFQKGTMEASTGKWYGLQLKDGKLTFAIDDGRHKSNIDIPLTEGNDIFDNTWKNIVAVRDTAASMIRLYLNGVEVGSKSSQSTTSIGQSASPLLIGNSIENKPYRDQMDDIRIYNNVLSPANISDLYKLSDDITLPVTISDFSGTADSKGISLSWQSAQEVNAKSFQVDRSSDGSHYSFFTAIPAKGMSTTLSTYDVIDRRPRKGANFYRLTLTNQDGSSSRVGETVVMFNAASSGFKVFPNPLYGSSIRFTISVNSWKNDFTASLMNISGVEIARQEFDYVPGSTYTMSLQQKPPSGIYLFLIDSGTGRRSQKLIVR